MTSIATNAKTTPVQAPGGARVGAAPLAGWSTTDETTTRETEKVVRIESSQAGGPDDALRPIRITPGHSSQNGKTVACRGAGQSARISFCLSMIAFVVTGRRVPGGIYFPGYPMC